MDWQTAADSIPSGFISDDVARSLLGKPPASGAWRDGDNPGDRQFVNLGRQQFENGSSLPNVRIAFETWGKKNQDSTNCVLILHALTGDSHVTGPAGPGHPTSGWWEGIIGSGAPIDTDRWFVVAPNVLGGCQGSTGPASLAPNGQEWGSRFPTLTIRDQVRVQAAFSTALGIERWAAVIGGSMGGMQVLEWAIGFPERVERAGILASPAFSDADSIALNSIQNEAIRSDSNFNSGNYYDATEGDGPHNGLALARRIALLSYRSGSELDERFGRTWQSDIDPSSGKGKFAVESYLDFHGNKFTRRFDANSYLVLSNAMSSHDVGRGRGGIQAALSRITAKTLVLGISSDRLFPIHNQQIIAQHLDSKFLSEPFVILESDFGHDGFLIEQEAVGQHVNRLLSS
ncbi:MAG: homoserine O-acetyltransferase [Microbacteriaceae bacterium]|nr:homoserine O-acetyltransferase [Cryobacterium sp.]MCC6375766.1 homoserine O-acetyltransferase [Microbacteriaceae bacterium]